MVSMPPADSIQLILGSFKALGDHTICAGSLNWLSAATELKDSYKYVALSIVLGMT